MKKPSSKKPTGGIARILKFGAPENAHPPMYSLSPEIKAKAEARRRKMLNAAHKKEMKSLRKRK